MQPWLWLTGALVMNAAANIMLKIGSNLGKVAGDPGAGASLLAKGMHFLNWPTLTGLILFAANVLVYRKALDRIEVSVGYPVMVSGGLILVTLAAWMLPVLDEKITWVQIAGMCVIGAGVWLVAMPTTK